MELEHFSHEHPLILNGKPKDDFEKYNCFGCCLPISGPCYSCSRADQCHFFMHKLCAELPQQQQHPLHPQHPLTLHAGCPYPASNTSVCDACGEEWCGFTYHCSVCGFDVDILCALMAQTIEHKGHKHPLITKQTPNRFFCHACREEDDGASYLCTTCRFWIHQDCASVPGTVQLSSHPDHPLTLSYSLPPGYAIFESFCDLCAKKLDKMAWVYFCGECRYHIHLKCAAKKMATLMDHKPEIEAEEDIEPNLILQLPMMGEYNDLRNKLIKNMSLGKNDDQPVRRLTHRSHEHPLIRIGGDVLDDTPSASGEQFCRGCSTQILSTTYYWCGICNFQLHTWCAELPEELPQRHPCHPRHPLLFDTNKVVQNVFDRNRCDVCSCICYGFTYTCVSCDFNIDVRCASLPASIKHQAHEHLLVLRATLESFCTACHRNFDGFTFTCETCDDFKLDPYCALLPGKITNHKYDEHPFSLTYSQVKGILEYICEICELFVNPKCWFYHCLDCDRSTHVNCLLPLEDWSPRLEVGDLLVRSYHRHTLRASLMTEDSDASCALCGKVFGESIAYECKRCNFWLHNICSQLPTLVCLEFDKHPLTITEIPIKGHSDGYFCKMCKLEITDQKVVYHCRDCNHSAHVTCICKLPAKLN